MSLEGSRASMDAQSTVSTTACMPHHVTETIAEEEQEEVVESQGGQGEEGSWGAAAATPATVSVGGEESGEAGQNWNWAWLAGQLPPEHGTNDPSTLLDDESEGELSVPYVTDWWAGCFVQHLHFTSAQPLMLVGPSGCCRDYEGQ